MLQTWKFTGKIFLGLWLLVASLFPEEPKIYWRSKQAKYFGHLSDGGQSVVGVRKWSKQRLRGAGTPSGQEEHLHPLYTPLHPLIPYLWSSDIPEHTKHNTSVCLPNYPTTEPHIYPSQSQQYMCNKKKWLQRAEYMAKLRVCTCNSQKKEAYMTGCFKKKLLTEV